MLLAIQLLVSVSAWRDIWAIVASNVVHWGASVKAVSTNVRARKMHVDVTTPLASAFVRAPGEVFDVRLNALPVDTGNIALSVVRV